MRACAGLCALGAGTAGAACMGGQRAHSHCECGQACCKHALFGKKHNERKPVQGASRRGGAPRHPIPWQQSLLG